MPLARSGTRQADLCGSTESRDVAFGSCAVPQCSLHMPRHAVPPCAAPLAPLVPPCSLCLPLHAASPCAASLDLRFERSDRLLFLVPTFGALPSLAPALTGFVHHWLKAGDIVRVGAIEPCTHTSSLLRDIKVRYLCVPE